MQLRNTTTSYGSVAKFFHWLIFLLVLFMLIYGFFMEDFPKEYQPLVYNIHKLTGLTILTLMILRLLWALSNAKPGLPFAPWWERVLERLVHFLLYFCLIAMPLSGWIGSVAAGRPPRLGATPLTLPIDKNPDLSDQAFFVHNTLAIIIIVLISLHVLAALYHYFFKKDGVLARMMPQGRNI